MNTKKFTEALNEVDCKYIDEAANYQKKVRRYSMRKWGFLAACFCLTAAAGLSVLFFKQSSDISNLQFPIESVNIERQPQSDSAAVDETQQQFNNLVTSYEQDEAVKRKSEDIVKDEIMTLEEALCSEPFGGYMLSAAPNGFTAETFRRYQDEKVNYLFGLWTRGEGFFDEISWRICYYDKSMENRLTSVDDTQNYDLSLYSIPFADSVPENLFEIVDHPVFSIDELTLEAVKRRAYSVSERNDTDQIRLSFGVRYGDIVVEVTAKGVSPEWIYEQLINVSQFG